MIFLLTRFLFIGKRITMEIVCLTMIRIFTIRLTVS